uniref:Secreted protein n=1 Tax=Rhipicephalus zambeziensis TaxID=60191 RepID=A0A224YGE7_9ACAR
MLFLGSLWSCWFAETSVKVNRVGCQEVKAGKRYGCNIGQVNLIRCFGCHRGNMSAGSCKRGIAEQTGFQEDLLGVFFLPVEASRSPGDLAEIFMVTLGCRAREYYPATAVNKRPRPTGAHRDHPHQPAMQQPYCPSVMMMIVLAAPSLGRIL